MSVCDRNAECGMRNAEGEMQEVKAEERTGIVRKIRMLNNLIESLTSVEWTDEQELLKEIREDYLTELEMKNENHKF